MCIRDRYGAYISTAIIAVCLLVYDWRLTIACLWGVPVAFGLLFGTRKISARASERTKQAAVRVSDGIQEALENVREIRATNQEARYLAGLNQKIDDHEKVTIQVGGADLPDVFQRLLDAVGDTDCGLFRPLRDVYKRQALPADTLATGHAAAHRRRQPVCVHSARPPQMCIRDSSSTVSSVSLAFFRRLWQFSLEP